MNGSLSASKSESHSCISVEHLTKTIAGKIVLDDLNLTIGRGEVFGLIGPDGAGKTTLFNVLMGFMTPQQGSVQLFGQNPALSRRRTSYLTQKFSCYPDLSVEENLIYAATIRGIDDKNLRTRQYKYLHAVGLSKFGTRKARDLSGGMKQKLALCCALISEPELLLLDEPSTGVDALSRREFWDLLYQLGSGKTILISTPYLEEAERCERVALMHHGKLTDVGTAEQLKANLGLQRLELTSDDAVAIADALQRRANTCVALKDVQIVGATVNVLTADVDSARNEIAAALGCEKIKVVRQRECQPTLEAVFAVRVGSTGKVTKIADLPIPAQQRQESVHLAISTNILRKEFGTFLAVDSLDLSVPFGTIYGLLGANGAGKTTTIKMLCGLLEPTSGEIRLMGSSNNASQDVRQRIGYMSQKFTLYDDLTIAENLEFYAGIYGVPRKARKDAIRWVLEFAQLEEYAGAMTGQIAGGLKQRVSLGAAIMHRPGVIFLDEPTSGMDPIARRSTWALIRKLSSEGAAVVVSTHYMDEAENCDRIGFMAQGRMLVSDSPENIRALQTGKLHSLRTDNNPASAAIIKQLIDPWKVAIFADSIHVTVEPGDPQVERVISRLIDNHVTVFSCEEIDFSLEDAFIRMISITSRSNNDAS